MGIVHCEQIISRAAIRCGEALQVRLSLTAEPGEGVPGAAAVEVRAVPSGSFQLLGIRGSHPGRAEILPDGSLLWQLEALGRGRRERAELEVTVQHRGFAEGELEIFDRLTCRDVRGQQGRFPRAAVTVDCTAELAPEPCPPLRVGILDPCESCCCLEACPAQLHSRGQMLLVDVTICRVCPNRALAAAVVLTEIGNPDCSLMKVLTIPPLPGDRCRDVQLRCIPFVLPEGCPCTCRRFGVQVWANYLGASLPCCEEVYKSGISV